MTTNHGFMTNSVFFFAEIISVKWLDFHLYVLFSHDFCHQTCQGIETEHLPDIHFIKDTFTSKEHPKKDIVNWNYDKQSCEYMVSSRFGKSL